jgi:hypothetical protein
MPHSPKKRAKRQKISNQLDQENSLTDQIPTSNTTIMSITNATNSATINLNQLSNPTNMPGNQHIQASSSNQIDQEISLTDQIPLLTTNTTSSITATNLATINSNQTSNETNMPKNQPTQTSDLNLIGNVDSHSTISINPTATTNNNSPPHPTNFIQISDQEPTIVQQSLDTPPNTNNASSPTNFTNTPSSTSIPTTTSNNYQSQPTNQFLQASNMEPTIVQTPLEIPANINNTSSSPNTNNSPPTLPETTIITAKSPTTTNSCATPQETILSAQPNPNSTVPAEPESAASANMAIDNSNHAITQVQTVISANTVNEDSSQSAGQINAPCDLTLTAPAPTSPQCSNWVTATDPHANQLTVYAITNPGIVAITTQTKNPG